MSNAKPWTDKELDDFIEKNAVHNWSDKLKEFNLIKAALKRKGGVWCLVFYKKNLNRVDKIALKKSPSAYANGMLRIYVSMDWRIEHYENHGFGNPVKNHLLLFRLPDWAAEEVNKMNRCPFVNFFNINQFLLQMLWWDIEFEKEALDVLTRLPLDGEAMSMEKVKMLSELPITSAYQNNGQVKLTF